MKQFFRLFVVVPFLVLAMAMTLQKKQRIVFFGDSITQMGVNPGGYISRMNDALAKKGLTSQYELVGAGIGGNKVYDLGFNCGNTTYAIQIGTTATTCILQTGLTPIQNPKHVAASVHKHVFRSYTGVCSSCMHS